MMSFRRYLLGFFILNWSVFSHGLSFDKNQDMAFSVNGWDESRDNAYLFLDPLCPYCKKVIPKIDNVADYNLYVFWAPIFGQRSEMAISPLFHCEQPTHVKYLKAFANKETPNVSGCEMTSEGLRARNDEWVQAYRVNSVPSVFVGGRRVSFSAIEARSIVPKMVQGVAVPWQRYGGLKQAGVSKNGALLWFDQDKAVPSQLLQQYQPAYVFSANTHQQQLWEMAALLGITDLGATWLIKPSGAVVKLKS